MSRITAGIVLIAISPLVWFLLVLFPIKGAYLLTFLAAGAVALYGVFLTVVGVADKRRKAGQGA